MDDQPTWWQKLLELDPALVRGFVVTVFALAGTLLGKQFGDDTVQNVIQFVTILSGLLAAVLIKPKVTANAKVLAYLPKPYAEPTVVASGEATVTPEQTDDVVDAALNKAA